MKEDAAEKSIPNSTSSWYLNVTAQKRSLSMHDSDFVFLKIFHRHHLLLSSGSSSPKILCLLFSVLFYLLFISTTTGSNFYHGYANQGVSCGQQTRLTTVILLVEHDTATGPSATIPQFPHTHELFFNVLSWQHLIWWWWWWWREKSTAREVP